MLFWRSERWSHHGVLSGVPFAADFAAVSPFDRFDKVVCLRRESAASSSLFFKSVLLQKPLIFLGESRSQEGARLRHAALSRSQRHCR